MFKLIWKRCFIFKWVVTEKFIYLTLSLIFLCMCMYTHAFSHVWLFVTQWNVAYYVPAAAANSLQSCPTLWDPRDGSPTGSPVPGILQARILEWVTISFSKGSSRLRDQTCISCVSCIGSVILDSLRPHGSRTWLYSPTSLVALMVKHLPTMQETWVQSLGQEDPLEKEISTHSSTLAQKIPWTEEPSRLQSMGSQRVGHDWVTSLSLSYRHGILQARILEWIACPFSRGSSQPKDWTQVSLIAGEFFTSWATAGGFFTNWAIREAPCVGRRVLYQLNHTVQVVKNLLANAGCKRCKFYPWVGKIPWSRKWHHTSVVLPGKFYGQRRLAGYSPWDSKESDMIEWLSTHSLVYK